MMLERGHDPRVQPDPVLRHGEPTNAWVGTDRTSETGNGQVSQYLPRFVQRYGSLEACPEELLLWFHRVPLSYRLKSGKTVMQHFDESYRSGPQRVNSMIEAWNSLTRRIPADIHQRVLERLNMQLAEAEMWRDSCAAYWATKAG